MSGNKKLPHLGAFLATCFCVFLFFTFVTLAQEQSTPSDGLVPIGCQKGCPCTLCDFYELGKNVTRFLLYGLSIPIAALAFLYGGFMLLTSGGNRDKLVRGKSAMTNAVIGLALAFFSWAILNVILGSVSFGIGFGGNVSNWYDPPSCESGGGDKCFADLPPVEGPGGKPGPIEGPGEYDFSGSIDGECAKSGYGVCTEEQKALLEGRCPNSVGPREEGCSWKEERKYTLEEIAVFDKRIADSISDEELKAIASRYGVSVNRIKAIIAAESSGDPNAGNQDLDKVSSHGLMQVRTDTARMIDKSLAGLSDAEVARRLEDPKYNINLGTKYYSSLLLKYSGDETAASAEYNGSPVANERSVNCPGLKKWQCEWDNNTHSILNERPGHPGYGPTRKYIPSVDGLEKGFEKLS